jgi:hypothetical protein
VFESSLNRSRVLTGRKRVDPQTHFANTNCSHIFFFFPLSLTPLSCPSKKTRARSASYLGGHLSLCRRRGSTEPPKPLAPNEAVLDDPDVNTIYVPLPTSLHVRWAILVAQKKQHLLLEKPPSIAPVLGLGCGWVRLVWLGMRTEEGEKENKTIKKKLKNNI